MANEGTQMATIAIIVSLLTLIACVVGFIYMSNHQDKVDLSGIENDINNFAENLNTKTSNLMSYINNLDERLDDLEDDIDDCDDCECDIDEDDFEDVEHTLRCISNCEPLAGNKANQTCISDCINNYL